MFRDINTYFYWKNPIMYHNLKNNSQKKIGYSHVTIATAKSICN